SARRICSLQWFGTRLALSLQWMPERHRRGCAPSLPAQPHSRSAPGGLSSRSIQPGCLMSSVLRLLRLVGAALLFLVPVAACADDGHLVIHSGDRAIAFNVEVVDTDAGREKGLMFRQSLAPDAGMLFDFKDSEQVAFWMQNTFIPLDMLFIAADGVIKTIHA